MELAHLGHSCMLVETGSDRLLFDPGTLSAGFEALRELTAVLVTHQHVDHLDVERLPDLLAANPGAVLVVDQGSAPLVTGRGIDTRVRVVSPGEQVQLGGTSVTAVGGEHAVIHPDIPLIPNVGFVIEDGAFYHPGDSLVVPQHDIDVLAVPASAPWLKISESVEFLRSVTPRVAVPIHEAQLADPRLPYTLLTSLAPEATRFLVPSRAEIVPV